MTCCTCEKQCAPHLPLDDWREIMSHNPFYFWQLAQNKLDYTGTPIPSDFESCDALSYKKGWQEGTVGRDEVYRAIIEAEQEFADFTGYYPFPTYDCYEQNYYCTRLDGRLRIRLPMRKVLEIGSEQLDFLESVPLPNGINPPPDSVFSDRDGDGVIDWFEVTVLNQTVDGLTLFFQGADWCDKPLCRNEISPICYEQVGDDVLISGHSWLLVRPILYGNANTKALDPNDLTIYADEVDLYRRTTNTTGAVQILSKPGHCKCGNSEECFEAEDAELCIINAEQGVVELKLDRCCCVRCIDKVCINYLSGDCGNEELIARLAAANLGQHVCCCENSRMTYWMQDFVMLDNRGRISTPLSEAERSNYFGTRRGQVDAWRRLKRDEKVRAARF